MKDNIKDPMMQKRRIRKYPEIPAGSTPVMLKKDYRKMPKNDARDFKREAEAVKSLFNSDADIETRLDGWANAFVGLAGKMDKRQHTSYAGFHLVSDQELECIYFGDGIGRRIVDMMPNDMTREGFFLESDDKKTTNNPEEQSGSSSDDAKVQALQDIEGILERLDAQQKYNQALKWARLYGGAVVVIGALDGQDLSQPLNLNRVKDIDYLRVVDRSDIILASSIFQMDPAKPHFGDPIVLRMIFYVGTRTIYQDVHVSRCVLIKGAPVPAGATLELNAWERFWGLSELQLAHEALKDYGGVLDSIANLMYEAVIGKYKVADLKSMLASGNENRIVQRMEIMNMAKSVLHGVLLGENEDFIRDALNFGGIGEVVDRMMMRLSAATGYPVTRLFGRSAAGMNATGEGDEGNYYDEVKSRQETILKPALRPLLNVLCAWKKVNFPVNIQFKPLYQLSEKDQADVDLKRSQEFASRMSGYGTAVDKGVLTGDEVYELEFGKGEITARTETPGAGMPTEIPAGTKAAPMSSPPDTDVPVVEISEAKSGQAGL